MKEKIKKWKEEVEYLSERQKEMTQRYNEKIRELRKKIQDGEEKVRLEENQQIANTVREICGEVTPESLELLKTKIRQMKEEEGLQSQVETATNQEAKYSEHSYY